MEALPLTRLLHDNMAIVMTFVFSQAPIKRLIEERFKPLPERLKGPYTAYPERVEDFSCEVPRRNATRACLEIAVLMRLIDDQHKIETARHLIKEAIPRCFGVLHRTDGTTELLSLREFAAKIIHAADLSWDLSDEKAPKLICIASGPEQKQYRWVRAEVDIVNLAFFCDRFVPELV
jgi:hypothetical protein